MTFLGSKLRSRKIGFASLFYVLVMQSSFSVAESNWPYPEDIPTPQKVEVGLAGEKPQDINRYLLAQGARSVSLSPDGETLAFIWSITGEPQLWRMPSSGGAAQQLTFGGGITFFAFSPNGSEFLIGRDAEGNEREGFSMLSLDGSLERQLLPASDAFRRLGDFSPDGNRAIYASTERNGRDFDLYVVEVSTGKARLIYESEFGFFPEAWQPNGDLVIVSETRGEDANDVYLLNAKTGDMAPLLQPKVAANFSDFQWLADGSGFYLATNQGREFNAVAFYDLASGQLRTLFATDADADNVKLAGGGDLLLWTTNEEGYSKLQGVDLVTQQPMRLPKLPAGVYDIDVSTTGEVVSVNLNGPGTPGDVYVWSIGTPEQVDRIFAASIGGLDPSTFVTPISLNYPAQDGVQLQGLLYLPDAEIFAGKRPVVVQIHGGPTAQSRPGFRPVEQYLVNRGIAVFAVNVRGSTGFGKTYARLDNQELRLNSVSDLVDTADFLGKHTRLDGDRLAVMGGSYGGYMVNDVLGRYPGVFQAGVSVVGVSDWVRALEEASPGLKASDRIEYGDIADPKWQAFYAVNSPINNADKINVPLLVSHGANDPRDPVTESDRIVSAVREAGHAVTYLRFANEGHSIRKLENRVVFYRAVADFLETNLANSLLGDTK